MHRQRALLSRECLRWCGWRWVEGLFDRWAFEKAIKSFLSKLLFKKFKSTRRSQFPTDVWTRLHLKEILLEFCRLRCSVDWLNAKSFDDYREIYFQPAAIIIERVALSWKFKSQRRCNFCVTQASAATSIRSCRQQVSCWEIATLIEFESCSSTVTPPPRIQLMCTRKALRGKFSTWKGIVWSWIKFCVRHILCFWIWSSHNLLAPLTRAIFFPNFKQLA